MIRSEALGSPKFSATVGGIDGRNNWTARAVLMVVRKHISAASTRRAHCITRSIGSELLK